jgi:hypothetical protein
MLTVDAAQDLWRRAAALEREVPGCRDVWWGRRTKCWLAVVRRGPVLWLAEGRTLDELRATLLAGQRAW